MRTVGYVAASTNADEFRPDAGLVGAALSVAGAIGVFGVVYGAVAEPVLGPGLTVVSSLVTFSGAAQFTMVGLLASGANAVGVVAGVVPLALRHLPLAAVLRPRLASGRARRALLSWFLTDETTGLALTRGGSAERTVAVTGALAYGAWIAGTVAGVAGVSVDRLAPVADAVFPVLFVGLAAVTARTRADASRAIVAGLAATSVLLAAPGAGVLGAVAVAMAVASWSADR
jgi:branched chain amino acid efflux pump